MDDMENVEQMLRERIDSGAARVAVLGQGYVGLPLALGAAEAGFLTYGVDTDEVRVEALRAGESYIPGVTHDQLNAALASNQFVPTTDMDVLSGCDVVVICVPTPVKEGGKPDVSFIQSAVASIASRMRRGKLVILCSTTYPGTTDGLLVDSLEKSGAFKVGQDVFVCFSPERMDPGNSVFSLRNTAKVVGGVTQSCGRLGVAFFVRLVEDVVQVSSSRCAEMAKLLENTFRSVNIALVNEIAVICESLGVDVWEAIDAATSKPYGFMPFYPGPGVGGHCIPVDPYYLSWKAKAAGVWTPLIDRAGAVNKEMPGHVGLRVLLMLQRAGVPPRGARILLLGVAYKRNVGDWRESPSLDLMRMLKRMGAVVDYHDPHVPFVELDGVRVDGVPYPADQLSRYDCVVLLTDHDQFDYPDIAGRARLIFDTRNAFRAVQAPHVVRLGAPMPANFGAFEEGGAGEVER